MTRVGTAYYGVKIHYVNLYTMGTPFSQGLSNYHYLIIIIILFISTVSCKV